MRLRARGAGLHWAALSPEEKSAHECCKLLFSRDGITPLINTQSSSMSTPLHCALSRGHTELVRLLVEMKADVDMKDEDGKKASDLAKLLGNSKEVRAGSAQRRACVGGDHAINIDGRSTRVIRTRPCTPRLVTQHSRPTHVSLVCALCR